MFKRISVFLYGVLAYALFFGSFLYAIGFLGNFFVPKTIDSGPEIPFGTALLINAGLLGLLPCNTASWHALHSRSGGRSSSRGLQSEAPTFCFRVSVSLRSSHRGSPWAALYGTSRIR